MGILDTEEGRAIEKEMMVWLPKYYDVEKVYHDGSLYEYPAIRVAREISVKEKCPVLYIHTKGAASPKKIQKMVRNMWRTEFSSPEKYFKPLDTDEPTVIAPFMGDEQQTWFNGFAANYPAWNKLNLRITSNRYYYENVFHETQGIRAIGVVQDHVRASGTNVMTREQIEMFKYIRRSYQKTWFIRFLRWCRHLV